MRDPERIDEVLNLIKSIWKSHPGLSLMQILTEFISLPALDTMYLSNELVVSHLKSSVQEKEKHEKPR